MTGADPANTAPETSRDELFRLTLRRFQGYIDAGLPMSEEPADLERWIDALRTLSRRAGNLAVWTEWDARR